LILASRTSICSRNDTACFSFSRDRSMPVSSLGECKCNPHL
jgi:hypothetical protein